MLKNCTVQHVFFPLDLKKTKKIKNRRVRNGETTILHSSLFILDFIGRLLFWNVPSEC